MNTPKPLDVLPNGATVIAVSGDRVLCYWGNSYVYWRWSFDENGAVATFSGHYFQSLSEAVETLIVAIGRF